MAFVCPWTIEMPPDLAQSLGKVREHLVSVCGYCLYTYECGHCCIKLGCEKKNGELCGVCPCPKGDDCRHFPCELVCRHLHTATKHSEFRSRMFDGYIMDHMHDVYPYMEALPTKHLKYQALIHAISADIEVFAKLPGARLNCKICRVIKSLDFPFERNDFPEFELCDESPLGELLLPRILHIKVEELYEKLGTSVTEFGKMSMLLDELRCNQREKSGETATECKAA